jgi:predicted nuclease with TOPRIM domain
MSTVGDALAALKNVVLVQERLEAIRADVSRQADDLKRLTEQVYALDKRVVRIETMIEMSGRGSGQARIEG